MKQCVAPVSMRAVIYRGPWAVAKNPNKRGVNSGLFRRQTQNSGPSSVSVVSVRGRRQSGMPSRRQVKSTTGS